MKAPRTEQGEGISRFEKGYWIAAGAVLAVVLFLWLAESLLEAPPESFEQQMERIVDALPAVDPYHPPTRDQIHASGPASELSTLGREAATFILERAADRGGDGGARWMHALAFYTQKHLHTERIAAFLVHDDQKLACAAADVLAVALEPEDREKNAAALLSHYDQVTAGVKKRILLSLAHLEASEAAPTVLRALVDERETVRLAASEAALLFTFPDEAGRMKEALTRLWQRDPSQAVRRAAGRALENYSLRQRPQ